MRLDRFNPRILSALLILMTASTLWANAEEFSEDGDALVRPPLDEVLAVSIDPEVDPKAYWQTRYRKLLDQRVVEERVIEGERELYADANRRNYRRGKKRHIHREAMLEAIARKAEVEERLVEFREEVRRAAVLPGWLYEVEGGWREPAIAPPAGPADSLEDAPAETEREGRNPLYLDDEGAE